MLCIESEVVIIFPLYIYANICFAVLSSIAAVILPSLQRLHGDLALLDGCSDKNLGVGLKKLENGFSKMEMEREEECGICLEPCTKMVLPNCCHSMCINCYRDW